MSKPTGHLDPTTASRDFDMLVGVLRDTGLAALIAAHHYDLAKRIGRFGTLDAGLIRA